MPSIQAIAEIHLHDLRVNRPDVLAEYVRTGGHTDWSYTEESVGLLVLRSGFSSDWSGPYHAALRLVAEVLKGEGVAAGPPAVRGEPQLLPSQRRILDLVAETPGLDSRGIARRLRMTDAEVEPVIAELVGDGRLIGGLHCIDRR